MKYGSEMGCIHWPTDEPEVKCNYVLMKTQMKTIIHVLRMINLFSDQDVCEITDDF